jgi:hypothetical protein
MTATTIRTRVATIGETAISLFMRFAYIEFHLRFVFGIGFGEICKRFVDVSWMFC